MIRGAWTVHLRNPETGELAPGETQWYRSPLYEETAHIPLIAHVPGRKPNRVKALVNSPDVMPTILELAGVGIPGDVQSSSLLPLIDGTAERLHDLVVTSSPLHVGDLFNIKIVDDVARMVAETLPSTITTDEWAMISSIEGAPVELYHLPSDPQQQTNVVEAKREIARDLQARFIAFLEKLGTDASLLAPRRKVI